MGDRRPPARPDPRPMRVVYGAGAVAAMSIMAVGLVQPDWTTTGDQTPTDGGSTPQQDQNSFGAVDANGASKAETGSPLLADGGGGPTANVRVRHVIRYVYLKPGQTAPPGATVVAPSAAATRRPNGNGHNSNGGQRPPTPAASHQPNNNPGPVATAPPTERPTPRVTPQPTPKPTPKTRQSGHR